MSAILVIDLGRLLYVGPVGVVPEHRCPATVVAVGLDAPFELSIGGHSQTLRIATTPAGVPRSVRSGHARMAVTLLDATLQPSAPVPADMLVPMLERLWRRFSPRDWGAYLAALGCAHPRGEVDPRVAAAVEILDAAADEPMGAGSIAGRVGLSVSQLDRLFKRHVGVTMSGYRRWCRLQRMARAVALGADLTAAAQEAGFYDAPHMNRAFRRAFGIVPTFVFAPGLRVDVVAPRA